MEAGSYVGRFAPSPTGPLHAGSLVTAVASYVDARANQGSWHVRMDDLDSDRCRQAFADDILQTLEQLGLHWDGPVVYQRLRSKYYEAMLVQLLASDQLYYCQCSRRMIREQVGTAGLDGGPVYPGTCRDLGYTAGAVRVRTEGSFDFVDNVQGRLRGQWGKELGDYVIVRADGIPAYHLAAVTDDLALGATDIVRGRDLLAASITQEHLCRIAGPLPGVRYAHVPLALDANSAKLSKQNLARPVTAYTPGLLAAIAAFLGHRPPDSLSRAGNATVLRWLVENWSLENVPADDQVWQQPT